jgi:hypothetical protein
MKCAIAITGAAVMPQAALISPRCQKQSKVFSEGEELSHFIQ